jgi:hypothetical protein
MMREPNDIVARLAEHKRAGTPFDRAWAAVVGAVPQVGRKGQESAERATWRHMRDAYNGEGKPCRLGQALSDDEAASDARAKRAARAA